MTAGAVVLSTLAPEAWAATRHVFDDAEGFARGFLAALDSLAGQHASYRSALLRHLSGYAAEQVRVDTERGIDGMLITDGGAEVWNAVEFSPWQLRQPVTLVMGDCQFGWDACDRASSVLEVHSGAALYIAGNLFAGSLLVAGGAEVHCAATLTVSSRLTIEAGGFCSAATFIHQTDQIDGSRRHRRRK